jgi:hypothetical protein
VRRVRRRLPHSPLGRFGDAHDGLLVEVNLVGRLGVLLNEADHVLRVMLADEKAAVLDSRVLALNRPGLLL